MSEIDAQDELLQRYFDGELAPSQAAQVEARLASDPSYAAQHKSLLRLRELISLSAETSSSAVDFNALYGRIESDVREDRQAPALLERLSVWWKELSQHRPAVAFGVPVAAAGALVIALLAGRGTTHDAPQAMPRDTPAPQQDAPAAQAAPLEQARYEQPRHAPVALAQSSEVVQVDFGDNTGTVFEIALAEGVSTPVVWINDEE